MQPGTGETDRKIPNSKLAWSTYKAGLVYILRPCFKSRTAVCINAGKTVLPVGPTMFTDTTTDTSKTSPRAHASCCMAAVIGTNRRRRGRHTVVP